MTNVKKLFLGTIIVFSFAALPLAQAENPGPDGALPKGHFGQRIQEIYNQLHLTDDQKNKLEANKKQHRAEMESARQSMKTDKEALQAELMKPQLDMSKITALHDQIKDLLSQMEDDKLNSILAVRAILTPEQFTKFASLMHKHKKQEEATEHQEHGE